MTSPEFDRLFGGPPREPETLLTQRELDLAGRCRTSARR
jgi:carbamoyltransferase